jgi:RNA polymerase sigma factor (sigma-70 family)
MPKTQTAAPLLRFIRDLKQGEESRTASDGELLRRFIDLHDETAFRAIVWRHGGMVYRMCLRVLQREQDAEDAFQATFMVLAQRARAVRRQDSLGSWLFGVAHRLACKMKRGLARRRAREEKTAGRTCPDLLAELSVREAQQLLDTEIGRLPEKYRGPFVLCCLEGEARDQAARQLGLTLAVLKRRLELGRELLRKRLSRRGLTLTAALLASILTEARLSAAVSSLLVNSTMKAATTVAAGGAAASVLSAAAAALTKGGLKTMSSTHLKICGALFMGIALLTGAVHMLCSGTQQPAFPVARAGQQKPVPRKSSRPSGPGTFLLVREDKLIALTPDGKEGAAWPLPEDTKLIRRCGRLSPDGRQAAYVVYTPGPPQVPGVPGSWPFKVVVGKLGERKPAIVVDLPAYDLVLIWAPDGTRLAVTKETAPNMFETVLLDPATAKIEPLDLPSGVRVVDWSRDGKTFLVVQRHDKKYQLGLAAKGDKEVGVLVELAGSSAKYTAGRLSPDGKKVLYTAADPANKDANANRWGMNSRPYLLDVATKKAEKLADFPENGKALAVAWRPDGKRIAYTWMQVHADLLKKIRPTEAFLVVADANGRNAQTVASVNGDHARIPVLGSLDWR